MAGAVDLSVLKQPPPGPDGAAAGVSGGVEVSEANFEAEVLLRSNEVPVVVLLWSPRSAASVELGDDLAALSNADGGTWSLVTANVDTTPRVAQMFGVQWPPVSRSPVSRARSPRISCAAGSTHC
jgi:putative thioredoxin